MCEAATGAKIARRRANVDVDVSSWRGRPYVCVSSWRGGWETSGLGNLEMRSFSPRMRQGEATEGSSFRRLDVGKRTSSDGRQSIASHPTPLRHQRHLLRARPTASHASAGAAPAPSKPYSTAARHASFVAGAAPWRLRLDASGKHASHAEQLCALRADVLETAVCEDTAVDEEAWDPCEELRERLEVRERCVR